MTENYNQQISQLVQASDRQGLIQLQQKMFKQREEVNRFVVWYLEKFDSKIDPKHPESEAFKLYEAKSREYSELNQAIKNTVYFLSKV